MTKLDIKRCNWNKTYPVLKSKEYVPHVPLKLLTKNKLYVKQKTKGHYEFRFNIKRQ